MIPALTVRQPWASEFFRQPGAKDLENRTWATSYRGTLLIHAAQAVDRLGLKMVGDRGFDHERDRGVVLGRVELVDCHEAGDACQQWDCGDNPWAFWPTVDVPRLFHWMVQQPAEFVTPIRASGRLGLWEPGPSVAHLASIAEVIPW